MRRRRGFIQVAILHLLREESMHGYQIMKQLEERSGGLYKASAGSVYPALQELLDKGVIELSEDESEKKIYSINESGKQRVKEHEENNAGENIWHEWREKLAWRNSAEFTQLDNAVKEWELELKKTMKHLRKKPENTPQLIELLGEMTERLKKDFR